MSSGCIPIVSDVSSMPQIVGESGFVVKNRKLEEVVQTIKLAINSDFNSLAYAARERIMNYYPEVNRANKLIKAIDRVAKK
jgi:glycosyltransferase involved in cell wall biosynthesis